MPWWYHLFVHWQCIFYLHFLHIKATENELEITYYKDKKSTHTFAYGEIEEIRFTDKSYTAVCIKREGRKPILFELNKDTPEQGFFLYTIPQILPNVFKGNSKEIAKKYVSICYENTWFVFFRISVWKFIVKNFKIKKASILPAFLIWAFRRWTI